MSRTGGSKRRWLRVVAVLLVLVILLGGFSWYHLFREVPQEEFASVEEYFKYGSIGAEDATGMPYWIWLVLPKMFPEYLPGPGGYASVGLLWEQGKEMPIGYSKKRIGYERVAINCAFCHAASVRTSPDALPNYYVAGPSHTLDALAYQRFLFQSASDPRFTTKNILKQISHVHTLSFFERMVYRLLIPGTRKALLKEKERYAWTDSRPYWGRGRVDPFNPVKVAVLGQDPGDTIGNADMVPIWNMRPREGMSLHWDGLNTNLTEVVRSSAIGDGARPKSIPLDDLQRMQDWLMDLAPPAFPFAVDAALAATGAPIFQQHCASCHEFGGARTGQVMSTTETGTDPHRAQMWTAESAQAYNDYTNSYSWDFNNFEAPGGYVSVPLDGVWIRAPYLHNGSVPSLVDLLEPPVNRPTIFYRGSDLYDPVRVGFFSNTETEHYTTRYDTSDPGNSNAGHVWGTSLASQEKRALIEYLKTL